MGVACDCVYILVFVQGSRGANHGKRFCGHQKENTLVITQVSSGF